MGRSDEATAELTPILPEYLVSRAGESPSAYAGRLTGEAFKLHREVERLRSAISRHRDAKAMFVSGDRYYSEDYNDIQLWETIDGA